jgi:hypothetical protein
MTTVSSRPESALIIATMTSSAAFGPPGAKRTFIAHRGPAVEDHGHLGPVDDERCQVSHQPPARRAAVAPPAVGLRADDIHPVDDEAHGTH